MGRKAERPSKRFREGLRKKQPSPTELCSAEGDHLMVVLNREDHVYCISNLALSGPRCPKSSGRIGNMPPEERKVALHESQFPEVPLGPVSADYF
jgi:hypothetical protein